MDSDSKEIEERLLVVEDGDSNEYTLDGSVDIKGNPALKHHTGNFGACSFLLCTQLCMCMASYGVGRNLVVYLKTELKEDNVVAARDVATWQGTCFLTTLIGAYMADSHWGNYFTTVVSFFTFFIGMIILTLSASLTTVDQGTEVLSIKSITTFVGLYLIAIGDGAIKPCISAFGADQFDGTDPTAKGSFFSWYYLSTKIASLLAGTVLVWVYDKFGTILGFSIPSLLVGLALMSFTAGSRVYRYRKPGGSPFTRICQVVVAAVRKYNLDFPKDESLLYGSLSTIDGTAKLRHTPSLRLLDKATIVSPSDFSCTDTNETINPWKLCTVSQVEELKILLRMLPIWATFILFASVSTQDASVFTEQGMVMNNRVGSFNIPPASLSAFNVLAVMFCAPIYDKIITPIVRKFTGNERGFSHLQRIGIGLFISIFAMVSAALVEAKRLEIAREMHLMHEKIEVPMSILWQVPQYILIGISEVFNQIGMLEFFYDESPDSMKSFCTALGLMTIALGSYVTSIFLTMVEYFTTKGGETGWIPENLNEGHLDRFYWLIAGLCVLNLIVFVYFSSIYRSKRSN
ncbi:hypothetical protein LUZ60_006088 [Juncus effusus]|nr:hypothetical protein LUZ60_006088 [Juncus effusus]